MFTLPLIRASRHASLGAGYSKKRKSMNGSKNIYKNPRKNAPVLVNRGRISSLGRALDCRAGGRGFDSRGRTNIKGYKMTEK